MHEKSGKHVETFSGKEGIVTKHWKIKSASGVARACVKRTV